MIKNYKKFNEGINHLLVGPTKEEIWNNIKELPIHELLIKSIDNGFIMGVQKAIDSGENIRYNNDICLRNASNNGHTDIVKLLLDKGADIHVYDDCCLRNASFQGHTDTVKLLLDRGADIHARKGESLRYARECGHYDTIKLLEEYLKRNYKNKK